MTRTLFCVLAVALMAAVITALDTSDVVEELPEGIVSRAANYLARSESAWSEGAADAMSDLLIHKDGKQLISAARSHAESAAPPTMLLQEDSFEEADDDDLEFTALESKSGVEKQQALAEAKIDEDQASLKLSGDAQKLEHLKGQMSIQVVKAKSDLKQAPGAGSPHAKVAAQLAQLVLVQSKLVQKDQSSEKLAKINIKKTSDLIKLDKAAAVKKKATKAAAAKDHAAMKEAAGGGDDAPSAGGDTVSKELLTEMKKWKGLTDTEGKAADDDKDQVATLKTSVQTYTEKLAKANADLLKTKEELQNHAAKHHQASKMYKRVRQKESHHKKMKALAKKIQKQEDELKVQKMKIAASKETLSKSMEKKESLEENHQDSMAKIQQQGTKKAKAVGAPPANSDTKAAVQHLQKQVHNLENDTPAVNAAVDAVSANLSQQDIEKELEPQIQKLQMQLSGADLKRAVDELVANTVATRVKTAFTQDPNVQKAVHSAVQQVKVHHAKQESKKTHQEAEFTMKQVDEASKDLEDAGSRFDMETSNSDAGLLTGS